MKDWLIKKLGGWTDEQHKLVIRNYQRDIAQLKKQGGELVKDYFLEYESGKRVRAELEHLEEWRNNVAKVLRQNKVPRHIVNKVMEMKK